MVYIRRPHIAVQDMMIRVANTTRLDLDQNLTFLKFWHWDILDFEWLLLTGDNGRFVCLRDVRSHILYFFFGVDFLSIVAPDYSLECSPKSEMRITCSGCLPLNRRCCFGAKEKKIEKVQLMKSREAMLAWNDRMFIRETRMEHPAHSFDGPVNQK